MVNSKRNFGLDIIRATAVLFVMVHHWVSYNIYPLHPNVWYTDLKVLGYFGVELFFVLSGFLIGNILIRTFSADDYSFDSAKNFWLRRWFRTLPMYYVALFIFIGIALYDKLSMDGVWKYFLFLQNIAVDEARIMDVSWSLAIEEWFYLSFPLVLIVLWEVFGKQIRKEYLILIGVLLFLLSGIAVRSYFIYKTGGFSWWDGILHKAVIAREDAIAYGVLGAWIFNFYPSFFKKYRYIAAVVGATVVVYGFIYFNKTIINHYYLFPVSNISLFDGVCFFSLVSLGVLLLLPLFYYISVRKSRITSFITYLSEISYSLYLMHKIALLIANSLFENKTVSDYCIKFYIFFGLSVLFAHLTYKYIELPFLKLRDRVAKKESSPV